jgi:hypothetical protein
MEVKMSITWSWERLEESPFHRGSKFKVTIDTTNGSLLSILDAPLLIEALWATSMHPPVTGVLTLVTKDGVLEFIGNLSRMERV